MLLVARDEGYMGVFANGPAANILGWIYLVMISIFGLAAIPLLIISHGGEG
jgi:hypothetical protein